MEAQPWIKISFIPAKVDKVQIFNFRDANVPSYAYRADNTKVSIWNGNTFSMSCEKTLSVESIEALPSQSYLVSCGSTSLQNTVKIESPGTQVFHLLEVLVLTKTTPERSAKCYKTGPTNFCKFPSPGIF